MFSEGQSVETEIYALRSFVLRFVDEALALAGLLAGD